MTDPTVAVAEDLLACLSREFRSYKRTAEKALAQVEDDSRLFQTLDSESNSLAILCRHIGGNLRSRFRDFLTTDGEKPDRDRDREFEPLTSRQEVMAIWDTGWATLFATLDALSADDLTRTVTIRQEPHTVVRALLRSLAHIALHTGQIVFLAKHLESAHWQTLSVPRGESATWRPPSMR